MSTGNPSQINWGILGAGRIATKFAEDLRYVPNARLHAVAAAHAERAHAFGSRFNIPHVFERYEDLLQCPDLDVVYIATPHTLHCENSLMCIEGGLAVLCEKPFAMHASDARRMTAAAQRNNVFLMDALWTRFIPATRHAFAFIEDNFIGEVHTVKADFGFHQPFDPDSRLFNKSVGGGSLLDIGIYPVLLSLFILGIPDKASIQAVATFAETQVDDSCVFTFQYGNGKIALGHSTVRSNTPTEAFIYGTKGHIRLHAPWHHTQQLTCVQYDGREESRQEITYSYEGWGYHFEAAHVTECLLQGKKESPLVPHTFSVALMETLDAIRSCIGLEYDVSSSQVIKP